RAQQPESLRVVLAPFQVLLNERCDTVRAQPAVLDELRIAQQRAVQPAVLPPQRVEERGREALLRPSQRLGRQIAARELPLDDPRAAPAHLEASRQRCAKLRNTVVEE